MIINRKVRNSLKIYFDVHTHTTASGHAYSSLEENIRVAKEKGLTYYGVSDHAPMMPGSTHLFYFQNLKVLPRKMYGVNILRGVEANIIDEDGRIDMLPSGLEHLDYVIASLHPPCIDYGTIEANTNAIIGAIKNPKVNIIGHPDDSRYPLDYEKIVKAAKEYKVMLEINNSSLVPGSFRAGAKENVQTILKWAKVYQVPVILSSDAHVSCDVGNFDYALEAIEEAEFPEELVINTNVDLFLNYIALRY